MRQLRALAAVCLAALPLAAATPEQWKADYDILQKWQYSAPVPLTKPVTITRDTATFTLTSGSVALAAPTASGRVTGFVFEGQGRFNMTVPDKYELAQLRRFADKPLLTQIDEPITQLVLRVSDDTIDKLFPGAAKGSFTTNGIAEKRQNHWLIDLGRDVDAMVVTAMANPGASHWTAGIKTGGYDWLTYDYDSGRIEEIQLVRFAQAFPEVWLSLDRAEDRTADGRPGPRDGRLAKLDHIDVHADLTKRSLTERMGNTEQRKIWGHYIVEETLTPLADGAVALPLRLHPWAQKLTAKDEKGQPLVVLRDHIGARTLQLDRKTYDDTLTLLFPEPLKKNEPRRITFDYDLESANYAGGNYWYPTVPEAFDLHTAKLQLTVPKKNPIRSMGRKESEKEGADGTTSVWLVEKPAMMMTFATAERFEEVPLDVKGIPQIVSFGWATGLGTANRVRNSGADVANALQFYQILLDDKVGGDKLYVTSITGNHGQAFDGFLHLAESTYSEHPGASELFRGHETAHEWFGHRVGWKTYRDQWLSESLAEYASMMFVQSTVKDGPKYFDEILDAYDSIVKGNLSSLFSKFMRPWLLEMRASARKRVGPIGIGQRASTADYPAGYQVQAYVKGPLVIHMLRSMLLQKTHNDDLFVKILRDYVHEYSGKPASTADFQKIVERDAPGSWSWFFDDWVYGAEIPSIRYSWKAEPDGSAFRLTLNVKRADVSPDFTLIAPVRLEFEGNKFATIFVPVKEESVTIQKQLPMKPRNVVLGADHSLLANIRKE
ncbi:MAG TPA: M1 family aminopeptidase [Thermoanaerobaculia bacterium]|nr:M1 family aminopeptidase [Thermoanaerobaculia bacterium]